MKKLLILNGSHSEITLIEAAKKLGYYVVTTGNNPGLIGHPYADQYIPTDYSDKDAILNLVKKEKIDRVVSCANDFGVLTASYVAEKMNWPGHDTYENANLLHQKDLFKRYIQNLGIRNPESVSFTNIKAAQEFAKNTTYPIIVKATDLTGGKGILKAGNFKEAIFAIDNAFNKSRIKHIVIEPFLDGIQQSIVAFVINKKVVCFVACDVFCPINPYLIQSETLPARNIDKYQKELCGIIEKICKDRNLVDGVFTLQYIVVEEKINVIEMMRRCLGNQFLTLARMITGFPWEEALVRSETGMDLTELIAQKPIYKYVGHHGIMSKQNGILKSYYISSEVEKHVFQKIEILKPGDAINDYKNERIAYLHYQYDNFDEMFNTVKIMNDLIKIELE